MRVATIIFASLMGHGLAALASDGCNATAPMLPATNETATNVTAPMRPASNATTPTPPAPGSSEDICVQTSAKVFDQCFRTPQRDEMIPDLRERCIRERDDAKRDCLDVQAPSGGDVGGDARKKEQECRVRGNRTFAACMKVKVLKKTSADREFCDQWRKNVIEACISGEQPKPVQQKPKKPAEHEATKPAKQEATETSDSCSS